MIGARPHPTRSPPRIPRRGPWASARRAAGSALRALPNLFGENLPASVRLAAGSTIRAIPGLFGENHLPASLRFVAMIAWVVACGAVAGAEPERAAAAPAAGTGGVNRPGFESRPFVVLVSFDGFHPDYLARFDTPHFDRLAARGMRAAGLVSVFPSLTFPGHYSIATGMHPEAHGMVGNEFFDPARGAEFSYRRSGDAQDGSWWGGEPIWVTAETQGMVAAAFFFPGTEADVGGVRPSHWRPYDGRVPNRERVGQVLAWLSLPAAERPHLVTLYFSLVDGAGHRLGPRDPGMRRSVERADRLLGRLTKGIDALPHAGRVVLVVVSDHGMAAPDPDRTTVLRAGADLAGVRLAQTGPAVSLHLGDPGGARALRDRLNARLAHARAYLREELPAHLHARGNRRLGDLVVLPDGLGMVRIHPADRPPAGMHGWDPTLPEMRGIFLAAGPGIAAGVALPAVDAVDVYPLLCHLLGLTPNPEAAGSLAAFAPALRRSPARQGGSGHAPRAHPSPGARSRTTDPGEAFAALHSIPGRAQPNAKQAARARARAVHAR